MTVAAISLLVVVSLNPVTGDNNRDRVDVPGHADGLHRCGLVNFIGNLLVRETCAKRDFGDCLPDLLLKGCALGGEGKGEGFALSLKVFLELGGELLHEFRTVFPAGIRAKATAPYC